MAAFLLSVHVLASIVLIGPITVAASLFPRYAREAALDPGATGVLRAMRRITSGYALAGLAVPVFGIALAGQLGVLGQAWIIVSMALTLVAALILGLLVVPGQTAVMAALADGRSPLDQAKRLGMVTGLFGLSWSIVVVLMILRPGSTTGV